MKSHGCYSTFTIGHIFRLFGGGGGGSREGFFNELQLYFALGRRNNLKFILVATLFIS